MADTGKAVFILLFFLVAGCVDIWAQDIIITRDGKRIEAKIIKETGDEVQYKEWRNQFGYTITLSAQELHTIFYKDGSFRKFDCSADDSLVSQNVVAENTRVTTFNVSSGLPIVKYGNEYYMGEQHMSESEYLDFIRLHCKSTWEYYQKGCRRWWSGWEMFGIGTGCLHGATALLIYCSKADFVNMALWLHGYVLLTVGLSLTYASIPCIIVGNYKKNNSHKFYNNIHAKQSMASVDIGIRLSGTGIGLAVNF